MTGSEGYPADDDDEAALPDPGPIRASGELLFRQVHPTQLQGGVLSSAIFIPTLEDKDQLSVDRSSLTTAKDSFDLFTGNGLSSIAVYGVTVGEFGKEGLPCHPDPLQATGTLKANPAHAYVDYTSATGTNKRKKLAQRLRTVAADRGSLHIPQTA
jgi:hypothetical protein